MTLNAQYVYWTWVPIVGMCSLLCVCVQKRGGVSLGKLGAVKLLGQNYAWGLIVMMQYWCKMLAQNIAKRSNWPNQCTAFCISIASSLLSLKHNSGQAASLRPISPNSLPFLHTHKANCMCQQWVLTSNKHIEHSVSYIHSIEAIGHLVAFLLFLWCTSTEHVKRRAAYMQWAYWALSSIRTMSILSIEQHTYNEHIEHWGNNI